MTAKATASLRAIALAIALQVVSAPHSLAHAEKAQSDDAACTAALASAGNLNSLALFAATRSCAQAQRQDDTNLLMIAGQIRVMADLTILRPLGDDDTAKATKAYGQLYYQFGGLGFTEVYRTPVRARALDERIRAISFSFTPDYDPGWKFRPTSKIDLYQIVLSNIREQRLWQAANMALLLQNDAYYEAQRAEEELLRKTPVLKVGTPEYDEHVRLEAQMRSAAKSVTQLPQPKDTTPYARLREREPDVVKRQVAMGFNGPATSGTHLFVSGEDVRKSWLTDALPERELKALIAGTDFSSQVLVAFSFGERMNASGQIQLSRIGYDKSSGGYAIVAQLSVVPPSCGVAGAPSYPFVVGVTEAVPGARVLGYSTSNLPDDCKPIVSGKPAK